MFVLVERSFGQVERRMIVSAGQEKGSSYMTATTRRPGKHVVDLPSFRDAFHLLVPIL